MGKKGVDKGMDRETIEAIRHMCKAIDLATMNIVSMVETITDKVRSIDIMVSKEDNND